MTGLRSEIINFSTVCPYFCLVKGTLVRHLLLCPDLIRDVANPGQAIRVLAKEPQNRRLADVKVSKG